ncbi:hypothetical protein AXY43_15280 [Clostridium sp. MF28]|uniref:tetratricopeptide repeat protein n=1 Tax=Clostridium TaxID=1485 RepID=UPI000B403839|nr:MULTISPECIES: tetratricopeptide repeat protein [Clostridium]AVK49251.1 hypothetical protein AXY43_15280 [Clostridium sp. MF28]OVE66534.1 hypothetical protein CCS79_17810 [Clostridium diolis]PSM57845.1 tetratricopeptide repeat protein [Clostridium diolis]
MNKKVKRAHDKAMSHYEMGQIDKALEICEDILLEGLDNPNVLNFKGLLLYQKGNLDQAVTVWKMNSDLNNDDIAKSYINDSILDRKRLELFRQGEQALKQLKVDKALNIFMRCAESDFNAIKVNTGIAMCYQRKGDFYRAREYAEKVLNIDKNAITAKKIEKELKDSGTFIEERNSSKGLFGIIIMVIVVAIVVGGYAAVSKYKSLNNTVEETTKDESDINKEADTYEVKDNTESAPEILKEEVKDEHNNNNINFNKDKMIALINTNDLDGIYEQIKDIKQESITSDDQEVYKQAVDLIKNQGVSRFYENGLKSFNENKYSDAKAFLDKAYTYCEGNSLKEHILFYRASSSSKLSDNSAAIKQYEEYYSQYPNGVYVEESLYDLALLNSSINMDKSKQYASILINNYPDSMYANNNIKNILKE